MKLDSHQVVFVLRVEHKPMYRHNGATDLKTTSLSTEDLNALKKDILLFHLHDLRSGLKYTFASCKEIQDYIKEQSQKGLR